MIDETTGIEGRPAGDPAAALARLEAAVVALAAAENRQARLTVIAGLQEDQGLVDGLAVAWLGDGRGAVEGGLGRLGAAPGTSSGVNRLRHRVVAVAGEIGAARAAAARRQRLRLAGADEHRVIPFEGSLDRWVLDQLLATLPEARRGDVEEAIVEEGWSPSALPQDAPERARRWVEWRAVAGRVVPLGRSGGRFVFYRDGGIREVSGGELSRVAELASLFGEEWPQVVRGLGLRENHWGEFEPDESLAVRALQPLAGILSAEDLGRGSVGDGFHQVDGGLCVVAAGRAWRYGREAWREVIPPVLDGQLVRARGLVTTAPGQPATIERIREALGRVRVALGGWRFEGGEWAQAYLAGFMLALPVMSLLPQDPPWLALRAPTSSGKTRLCKFITQATGWLAPLGQGTAFSAFRLLDGAGVGLLLDDVEGDAKAERRRDEILGALRAGRAARGTTATPRGVEEYSLCCPLIHSGIHDPALDQDVNRMLEIRLARQDWGFPDPLPAAEVCAEAVLETVQWGIAGHLQAYLAACKRATERLAEEGVAPRYARNLAPVIGVYLLLGDVPTARSLLDGRGWGIPQAIHAGETEEEDLLELLLSASLPWEGAGRTTLRQVIARALRPVDPPPSKFRPLPRGVGVVWEEPPTGEGFHLGLDPLNVALLVRDELRLPRLGEARRIRELLKGHRGFVRHSFAWARGESRVSELYLPLDEVGL